MRILPLLTLAVGLAAVPLRADPPAPAVSQTGRQDLFGPWHVHAVPDDPAQSEAAAIDSATWVEVKAPFLLSHLPGLDGGQSQAVHFAWARRRFTAPSDTQFRNAVLHLHGVRWGSKVWLNGREVGEHLGAYGAFQFDVSDAIRWGEPNELLIRLTGWPQVPMSKSDDLRHDGPTPLLPHGAAMFGWGNRQSGIIGGVWIDYFDYARLQDVLVLGDPESGQVAVRGGMRNYTRQFGRRWIEPTVLRDRRAVARGKPVEVPWPNTSYGRTIFEFQTALKVDAPTAWSPDSPALYRLRLDLVQEGRLLDRWEEDFGFRTFQSRPEGFFLNGKRFFLRGICTWGQNAYWRADDARDPARIQRFLVDLQRAANLNCVRNHTIMLDGTWLEVADRTGYLVLQEFPITMNYRQPNFTPEERDLYHRRCLDEFRSVLPLYWNHPSVVVWVPTNESGFDTEWENGPLYRMFKDADPSRPVMRASEQSPDILDAHCYSGFWMGPEGAFALSVEAVVPRARAAGLPLTNTEYIENFGGGRVTKWMGPRPDGLDDGEWERRRADVYAQFILEQTEVLRRLGYDGTLPYAWSRAYVANLDDPAADPPRFTPAFFALRSGQSPLLASLDLADRHFTAGAKRTLDVVLCDDAGAGRAVEAELLLVRGNPGFASPTDRGDVRVVWSQALRFAAAGTDLFVRSTSVDWPVPDQPGSYFLLAVVRPDGRPPAVSRRIVEVVAAPAADRLAGRTVAVLATDGKLSADLAGLAPHAKLLDAARDDLADADVLLIGPFIHRRLGDLTARAEAIDRRLAAGGRVIVLEQDRPIAPLTLSVPREPGHGGSSTAFRTGPADFVAWRGLGEGEQLNSLLRRFNGPTGSVVRWPVTTQPDDQVHAMAAQGSTDLNWAVIVSRRAGKREIIFCQMPLAEHLTGPHADPVAQTLLLNLLDR